MIGELLKIAAALIVEELRASLRTRAKRKAAERAFINGPPATTVTCDRCGLRVPASDAAMAAHTYAHTLDDRGSR